MSTRKLRQLKQRSRLTPSPNVDLDFLCVQDLYTLYIGLAGMPKHKTENHLTQELIMAAYIYMF